MFKLPRLCQVPGRHIIATMKLAVISLLIAGSTAWTPLAPRGRAAPTRAWSGSSDGGSEGRAPLDRRQLLSAVAVATAFFAPRAAQALDLPTFPKMSLPSAPSLPTLPTLDDLQASAEATGEALKPEFLKPENQQMVDVLSAYRQPLAGLQRELAKMRTEPQPLEDKAVVFATVQAFLDPKLKKSLLRELDRAAPLMAASADAPAAAAASADLAPAASGVERTGLAVAAAARAAVGALVAATREGDLAAERAQAAQLSALLEEAFTRLGDFQVPPPVPVGNGKLLGVF